MIIIFVLDFHFSQNWSINFPSFACFTRLNHRGKRGVIQPAMVLSRCFQKKIKTLIINFLHLKKLSRTNQAKFGLYKLYGFKL